MCASINVTTNCQWCSYSYTKKEERKEKSIITKQTRCTHTFAVITSCFIRQAKNKSFQFVMIIFAMSRVVCKCSHNSSTL